MSYQITEPHPAVNPSKRSTYLTSGRGGAGNISRYTTASLTSGPSAAGAASSAALSPPPTSARMMTGRGGAGNVQRTYSPATAGKAATKSHPRPSPLKARSSSQSSGSDLGACPVSPSSEYAIFSFDEELERDQRMRDNAARTPVYHIGRGGAGNAFHHTIVQPVDRRYPGADRSSIDSNDSAKRKSIASMVERISRTLSRS